MEDRPIGNIAQGLQGVVPNLNIDFASGDPTASTTFNIRGTTSLNGGSALLLVDGVETEDLSLLKRIRIERCRFSFYLWSTCCIRCSVDHNQKRKERAESPSKLQQ